MEPRSVESELVYKLKLTCSKKPKLESLDFQKLESKSDLESVHFQQPFMDVVFHRTLQISERIALLLFT